MDKLIFDPSSKIETKIYFGRTTIPAVVRNLLDINNKNESEFVAIWNVAKGGDKLEMRIEKVEKEVQK